MFKNGAEGGESWGETRRNTHFNRNCFKGGIDHELDIVNWNTGVLEAEAATDDHKRKP